MVFDINLWVTKFRELADRVCPPRKHNEDRRTQQRLEGMAYGFTITWVSVQSIVFTFITILFLFSSDSEYMKKEDCCTATAPLTDSLGIPISQCSQNACRLYNFVFDDDRDLIQKRPRNPKDGDFSRIFEYNAKQYCCNLHPEHDAKCCATLPFGKSCGAVMWVSCFSAICAMLMVQVILQGFYSYVSRRESFWVPISSIVAVLLRVFSFFFIFYIFWGFMFAFIFFWVAMFYCDNPHAYDWSLFGLQYMTKFFSNLGYALSSGASTWDGNWDTNAMVGFHSIWALIVDVIFGCIYVALSKMKDNRGKPYMDLTYFNL